MKRLVLAGPYRQARRYAHHHQLREDQYLIITRAHQLAALDPQLIIAIIVIELPALGQRIVTEITEEINRVLALYPVAALPG